MFCPATNVISLRKGLRKGTWPDESRDQIPLKEHQVRHLVATVPCIRLTGKTCTEYYFPEAKAFLHTTWYGNGMNGELHGTLIKDFPRPVHADGTPRYVITPDELPLVLPTAGLNPFDKSVNYSLSGIQSTLWIQRKPYNVRIEGYESIHDKGWPKDKHFGTPKTMLSVHDGDFRSYYLSIELFHSGDWYGQDLAQAVEAGEYDGSISPDEFENIIHKRWAEKKARLDLRLEFESFVRTGPVESINRTIERHNKEVDAAHKFLRVARELRKAMRANPDWYRKVAKVTAPTGLKSSQLFRSQFQLRHCKGTIKPLAQYLSEIETSQ